MESQKCALNIDGYEILISFSEGQCAQVLEQVRQILLSSFVDSCAQAEFPSTFAQPQGTCYNDSSANNSVP